MQNQAKFLKAFLNLMDLKKIIKNIRIEKANFLVKVGSLSEDYYVTNNHFAMDFTHLNPIKFDDRSGNMA